MLPDPVPRRRMHTRQVRSDGFRRDDGLWDIEVSILDTKSYAYREPARGMRQPGDPVHQMVFRLTVDDAMTVRALHVAMPAVPYAGCTQALASYQALVGRRVGPGWRAAVIEAAGGKLGCTHVSDLLMAAGATVVQTLHGWPEDTPDARAARLMHPRPPDRIIDRCSGLAAGGEGAAHVLAQFRSAAK